MSTLYVLDWHRRNSGYYNYLRNITDSGEEDPGLSFIFKPNEPYKAPDHSKAPPLTAYCGSEHCRMYCCADVTSTDLDKNDTNEVIIFAFDTGFMLLLVLKVTHTETFSSGF